MHWIYSCPYCQSPLNPEDRVVLRAECEGRLFLAGLHPKPGNYEVELPPGEVMAKGTRWNFSCPVCDRSLVSELSEDLCALDVHAADDRMNVLFIAADDLRPELRCYGKLHIKRVKSIGQMLINSS